MAQVHNTLAYEGAEMVLKPTMIGLGFLEKKKLWNLVCEGHSVELVICWGFCVGR